MDRITLQTTAGKKTWQAFVERRTGSSDPDSRRQDPLTLRVFGRPVTAREAVAEILSAVRNEGDNAVLRYVERIDGLQTTAGGLRVSREEIAGARRRVPLALQRALKTAAKHIGQYHRMQKAAVARPVVRPGVTLREISLPLERVGIYVPGGNAPLISTVLMNALPAAVAGVREIAMATPPGKDGRIPPSLLVAAELAGVREIYRMGGAVAIAALAYGTQTVKPVAKIVGPGNVFVTEAKRQLVGRIGIDSLAGPSEILILADESANPENLLWDLLAQSEHGSGAVSLLLSPSETLLAHVARAARELEIRAPEAGRALQSVAAVKVRSLEEGLRLANAYAPEHLSLQVRNARACLGKIRRAGAVFIGAVTAQAMGDYVAGTNHVLPTSGTAAWASALSVRDFLHHFHAVEYTQAGLLAEGPAAIAIAEAEGLNGHAQSIRQRMNAGSFLANAPLRGVKSFSNQPLEKKRLRRPKVAGSGRRS